MSFAVLATVVPNIIITEKNCVEKTYPEFWDDIVSLGSVVEGTPRSGPTTRSILRPNANIILVGMRGSGKTTIASFLSKSLKMPFVDIDAAIAEFVREPLASFIEKNGWTAFREAETKVLSRVLESSSGTIIACGGGIVETDASRSILQSAIEEGDLSLWINRHIDDIMAYLAQDSSRPSLGEPYDAIFARRKVFYEECSNFEVCIARGDSSLAQAQLDVLTLVEQLLGQPAAIPGQSAALSLTYSDIVDALDVLDDLQLGVDAVELRVDMLKCGAASDASDSDRRGALRDAICRNFALLRRNVRVPIIYTIRTKSHGGNAELSPADLEYFLRLGLRLGANYVDVELNSIQDSAIRGLVARRHTSHVLGSFHGLSGQQFGETELVDTFQRMADLGVDVCKIAIHATTADDSVKINQAASVCSARSRKPCIGLCMGAAGKMSRLLNTCLTFVTHPLLPFEAAPGQITIEELRHTQASLGIIAPRSFLLFGSPISLSPSPILHNAAFATLGLGTTFHYDKVETSDVTVALARLRSGTVGGASVTIPLKEEILPHMHSLSPAALCIGAVNTVSVRVDPCANEEDENVETVLVGDNTDWIGIQRLASRLLASAGKDSVRAVVVGAGGTARAACYALHRVAGVKSITIVNRTRSKAEAIAARFACEVADDIETLAEQGVGLVVSTLPSSVGFTLPAAIAAEKPCVIDAAYSVGGTALVNDSRAKGCSVAVGLELLFEQATAQNEIWSGRRAPRGAMATALVDDFDNGSLKSAVPETLAQAIAEMQHTEKEPAKTPGRSSIGMFINKIEQKFSIGSAHK